jgi:hypothetical protein
MSGNADRRLAPFQGSVILIASVSLTGKPSDNDGEGQPARLMMMCVMDFSTSKLNSREHDARGC